MGPFHQLVERSLETLELPPLELSELDSRQLSILPLISFQLSSRLPLTAVLPISTSFSRLELLFQKLPVSKSATSRLTSIRNIWKLESLSAQAFGSNSETPCMWKMYKMGKVAKTHHKRGFVARKFHQMKKFMK